MRLVFYAAIGFIVYAYLVFPLLILARSWFWRRPVAKNEDRTPLISVIVACYNEEQSIADKLESVLACDYPSEKLEIVVVSDGSNDRTDEIVGEFADRGVVLLSVPRRGKAPALNDAVAVSKGEVLVFSDANSAFDSRALRALAAPFADPEVGGVAGNQCYSKPDGRDGQDGERAYWSFDRWLKILESSSGNTISATGAIYALRRSAFRPVPAGVTDDFVTSTRVIAQGLRLVFEPDAIAREPVAPSNDAEFRRKVRVMTRGLRAVSMMRELLNPFRFGFYSLQLLSHKVLRRLVFVPQIALALAAPFLWNEGLLYQAATLGQIAFYGAALLAFLLQKTGIAPPKLLAFASFFCMVNFAAAVAWFNFLRGHSIELWEPQREAEQHAGAGTTERRA